MPGFAVVDDGPDYQPRSSEDDEWECEPRRPHKTRNDIQSDRDSVALEHHHLSGDTDLEVGTVISIGDILELRGGSFLMITEPKRSKNSRTVKFVSYPCKPIEDFEDYLPVEFAGGELVWIYEATEHDPKPEGYRRYAHNKDVLRIRHIVFTNSPGSFPEFQATGMFMDLRHLVCQWKLETELSNWHVAGKVRSFGSTLKQGQGQPRAFKALSNQELSVGGTMAADLSYSQHQLDNNARKDSSDKGPCQSKDHVHTLGGNLGTGKEHRRDAWESLVLAPNTKCNRIAKLTHSLAIRKCLLHLKTTLARALKHSPAQRRVSEQGIKQRTYTFADAICRAVGMSMGARAAGLCIEWAFNENGDAIDTYSLNHGEVVCKRISAHNFSDPGSAYGTPKMDILHLSPSCQGFSLVCRGSPKIGKIENTCMTYAGEIVKKVEPRIVALEEVSQVLSRHGKYFITMVHDLTSIDYNVRWRKIECADFSVLQKRKCLFMIACCRGEPLSDFPKCTHSHPAYCDELHLQPWNTVKGAIDNLEDSAPNHLDSNPRRERRIEIWARPHPEDWPCRDTVTTGQNWPGHYGGNYVCTVREAACLQGFPTDYEFRCELRATQKQVANAAAPPVGKAILEEIKRSLMRTDASKGS